MTNISNLKELFQGHVELHDGTVVLFSVGTPSQLSGQIRTMNGLCYAARGSKEVLEYMPRHQRDLIKDALFEVSWFKRVYAHPIHAKEWMAGTGRIELYKGLNWCWSSHGKLVQHSA